ncbi:MAG: hypothetical protein K2Y37_06700 [Pirellulales bacterium]|nr:hypothetical protein [Pirellulales bacterium]
MTPHFFRVDDNHTGNESCYPWGQQYFGTLETQVGEPACPQCGGRERTHYAGTLYIHLEGGREWSDVIGVGGSAIRFLISERVLTGLHDAGIDSFEYYQVEIAEVRSRPLRRVPPPPYYYIWPTGRIDIDPVRTEFKLKVLGTCDQCGRLLFEPFPKTLYPSRYMPDHLTPKLDTWDGTHLLKFRNYESQVRLCTERVLRLAREQRWTNSCFEPVDISRRDSIGWRGIDYLGPQWPPKWYPDPASFGKTPDEWREELRSDDTARQYAAFKAFRELGEQGVAQLGRLLDDGQSRVRIDAARILIQLAKEGVEVSEALLERSSTMEPAP